MAREENIIIIRGKTNPSGRKGRTLKEKTIIKEITKLRTEDLRHLASVLSFSMFEVG